MENYEEQPTDLKEFAPALTGGTVSEHNKTELENYDGSSLGKFKNAEALQDAYNSLQAEFTRRCQKVKDLEREVLELKEKSADTKSVESQTSKTLEEIDVKSEVEMAQDSTNETERGGETIVSETNSKGTISQEVQADKTSSEVANDNNEMYDTAGNEKLPSYLKEDYKTELSKFLSERELAKTYAKEIGEEMIADGTLTLESAYNKVLAKKYREPSELAKDKTFINDYILNNEEVMKEFIKKYKNEKQDLPKFISNSSGKIAQSYPSVVSTIKEAGELAFKLLS